MFDNANVGGGTVAEVIGHLFQLPANGEPMTIMQLAGFPVEVVDSVVSVLCRMAFDFSCGATASRRCCSSAKRPPLRLGRQQIGFGPTRRAVSYRQGRPQVRRLSRPRHAASAGRRHHHFPVQYAVYDAPRQRSRPGVAAFAVSDAAANLLSFVPSLGTREVLAFGEGVALPTRLRFKEVPVHQLPRSKQRATVPSVAAGHDMHFVSSVLERYARSHLAPRRSQRFRDRAIARSVEAPCCSRRWARSRSFFRC